MDKESPRIDDMGINSVTHKAEEGKTYVEGSLRSIEGVNESEAREFLSEAHGVDPDAIGLRNPGESAYRFKDGSKRLSVGFSRWNSSWNPKAKPTDPSQN